MKKYEAMVLSCMDPRFQPKVYKYLKTKKLTGKQITRANNKTHKETHKRKTQIDGFKHPSGEPGRW